MFISYKTSNIILYVFSSFIYTVSKEYSLGKERIYHMVVRDYMVVRVLCLLQTNTDSEAKEYLLKQKNFVLLMDT